MVFHFSNELWSREDGSVPGSCFPLHHRPLTCIYVHSDAWKRPCADVHHRNKALSEGLAIIDFGLKDFSTFLETFDNSMFLQIVDTL